jgi:pimeloyl-ACP methyl ester carboxylesterase
MICRAALRGCRTGATLRVASPQIPEHFMQEAPDPLDGPVRWPPQVRYAAAGDASIGYQVIGEGPVDLVWITGMWSSIEVMWEEPTLAAFLQRLASFSRLILFDRRGCGVSDRGGDVVTPTLEERVEDVLAVLDAVGSQRAALFGFSEGGNLAALFAATQPERTSRVILYGAVARFLRDDDHPWGLLNSDEADAFVEAVHEGWGQPNERDVRMWAPSMAGNERFTQWYAKWRRNALSRNAVVPFLRASLTYDLVDVYPVVRVPALVLHRRDDVLVPLRQGRWIAERLPDAELVELPGRDHWPFVGDAEAVLAEVERFLVGPATEPPSTRKLLSLVVVDVIGATEGPAAVGDEAWRALLAAYRWDIDDHLTRFGGERVTSLGDGCRAVFDGPARAIRAAVALADAASRLGLGVRVGVHCGECEVAGGDVQGVAAHLATRIAALAATGEVLVSGTVRDLVAGSGIRFGSGRAIEPPPWPGSPSVFPVVTSGGTSDNVRRLAGERANLLRRDGEYWTVVYDGQVATLRDTKGLGDLAHLLAAPGREIHALDLMAEPADPAATVPRAVARDASLHVDQASAEPLIDVTARRAYQRRIAELEQALEGAERSGDAGATARAREEIDILVAELTAAYGLGGRTRQMPDHIERARKAVTRRLRSTVSRIREVHPPLGRHLDTALRTGTFCSYQPDRELMWMVESPPHRS